MSKTAKAAAVPREQEWLNGAERARLKALEDSVVRGLHNAVIVGEALVEIRDGRLYRETGATFEHYCKQRFSLSRPAAYRYIDLVEVRAIVSPAGDTPAPTTTTTARELASLRDDPDAMREAWSATVDAHGAEPTAAQVREVVRGPGDDLRFSKIENVAASLDTLPARIAWPVEDGDVEAMDRAFDLIAEFMRRQRPEWRAHKASLKASKRTLRAVA